MKIEIWSDYRCPFCYIGKRKLEMALKEVFLEENITLVYKSFELAPDVTQPYEGTIHEYIAAKYRMALEDAKEMNGRIVNMAAEVGLTYDFEHLKISPSFDAHRLSHYAKEMGKGAEYTEKVMYAYFTDAKDISKSEVLIEIINEIALDEVIARNILSSELYSEEVRRDELEARKKGINSVPYFVFNDKETVSGAQSIDVFKSILNGSVTQEGGITQIQ